MSPKHEIHSRNSENTEERLLSAVGEILVNHGHEKLITAEIARVAEVDKNMINHHFGNLDGLLKAYLREKDLWLLVKNEYQAEEDPREYLKKVFIEQFELLSHSKEMQAIIQWQQNSNHPVIRAFVEKRNQAAEKLLEKFDKDPSETKYMKRSLLISLITGGIYWNVLLPASGKMSLLNKDITKDPWYSLLQILIKDLVDWAWRKDGDQDLEGREPKRNLP